MGRRRLVQQRQRALRLGRVQPRQRVADVEDHVVAGPHILDQGERDHLRHAVQADARHVVGQQFGDSAGMARHMVIRSAGQAGRPRRGERGAGLDPGQPGRHPLAGARRDGEDLQAGLTRSALAMQAPTVEIDDAAAGRDLFSSISSAAANMSGYLSGLSSPSVTDSTTTLCASPRSKAAGQTRLPTFSMNSRLPGAGSSFVERMADHVGVEVAALAGVDLHRRGAGGADAVGVVAGLLVALDHRDGVARRQRGDGAHQQRGLARARAGDEVEGEDATPGQTGAVGAAKAAFFRGCRARC